MINNINDLIEELNEIKVKHGNLFVRLRIQVPVLVPVEFYIDKFYGEDKTLGLEVLIIKGYKDK